MVRSLTTTTDSAAQSSQALSTSSLYRAVWRWHFYAGLLVMPLLIWLAVTGALFVYHEAIDQSVHAEVLAVPAPTSPTPLQPHSAILGAALKDQPGVWFKYTPPSAPDRSAEVGIRTMDGAKVAVYVDPYQARVLGSMSDRGTLGWTIRKLHSLKYFGPIQRGFIEMAAGWAILLVLTGIYLWWPRGRKSGVVSVRGTPRQRVFWRDLHAVTGLVVGAGLLFLAITGMPWSVLWGAQANAWANGHNFGYPAGVRVQLPMSGQPLAEGAHLPWTLQQVLLPGSKAKTDPHAGHNGDSGPPADQSAHHSSEGALPSLDIDAIMVRVQELNLAPGFTINPPNDPLGVFTASAYPHELERQRVVHLDQYSGEPLLDMSYSDYGLLGRWLEWGINVHLGQEFGVLNQLLLVAVCAGIVLLCVSGAVMWLRRRPAGRMGQPPLPAQRQALAGVTVLLVLGGLLFPLTGLSMLVIGIVDGILVWRQQHSK